MRAGAAACVLAALAATGGTARADELPTSDDLVAHNRAAMGADRRPETEREGWTLRSAGLDGTLEIVRAGADTRAITLLGPFRTERGVARGQRWHQTENGQTVLDVAEPSQVERVLSHDVARVRDPVEAWLDTTTYASGHVLRTYYDPRTWFVVRTETAAAGRIAYKTYDDFRTDARGRTRAWHSVAGDDRADSDSEYRLVRDEIAASVPNDDLTIPKDRRVLVELPDSADTVRVPARVVDGRVYVRLDVAGRGLDFVLDSGSSSIAIDDGVARELGLASYGRAPLTVTGSFATRRVVAPLVTVGPLAMHDVVMRTIPFAHREATGTRVVGLLGFDFFDSVVVRVDYGAGTVDALRPGTNDVPAGATALDIRLNRQVPVTRAIVGDVAGDDFIVDTGAQFGVVVFGRLARGHADALPASGAATERRIGSGVGGPLGLRTLAVRRLALGPLAFSDVETVETLAPSAFGFDSEDGLIGANLLDRFTVDFDYGAGKIYLWDRGAPQPERRSTRPRSTPRG